MDDKSDADIPESSDDPRHPTAGDRSRTACPSCGSGQTQPFTHAGPGARVNMKCRTCGYLFKDKDLRS